MLAPPEKKHADFFLFAQFDEFGGEIHLTFGSKLESVRRLV
jgi:hypothetical protein